MDYHKVTKADCLTVATPDVKARLGVISDMDILKSLATIWCAINGYKLGGYLGNDCWDATKKAG